MSELSTYRAFIASKSGNRTMSGGFQPGALPSRLFAHQAAVVDFACREGRTAAFLDTGLGKSGVQAVFADQCVRQTNKPALILTPLAVAEQMREECEAFGVEAAVIREQAEIARPAVYVANYERLHKLDLETFGAVCLDEASILKAYGGKVSTAIRKGFENTPYRLAATATPAPNDHVEIGQQSDFLGVMPGNEMLSRWFVTDQTKMGAYRLKGHAVRPFWRWVASWARSAALPSDLGGEDTGYILPELRRHAHVIETDLTDGAADGDLFRIPDTTATGLQAEKARTVRDRCDLTARLVAEAHGPSVVWCERNDESAALAEATSGVELLGSMDPDRKAELLTAFRRGEIETLVTKAKLAGFGVNWQHCGTQVWASLSHSYEAFYQGVRRSWRFGRTAPVDCHVIITDTERPVWANVQRKAEEHDRMKREMVRAMRDAGQSSALRLPYTRPEAVTLPKFMERRIDHAA